MYTKQIEGAPTHKHTALIQSVDDNPNEKNHSGQR